MFWIWKVSVVLTALQALAVGTSLYMGASSMAAWISALLVPFLAILVSNWKQTVYVWSTIGEVSRSTFLGSLMVFMLWALWPHLPGTLFGVLAVMIVLTIGDRAWCHADEAVSKLVRFGDLDEESAWMPWALMPLGINVFFGGVMMLIADDS